MFFRNEKIPRLSRFDSDAEKLLFRCLFLLFYQRADGVVDRVDDYTTAEDREDDSERHDLIGQKGEDA